VHFHYLEVQKDHVESAVKSFVELLDGIRDILLNEVAGKYLDSIESFVDAKGSIGKLSIYTTISDEFDNRKLRLASNFIDFKDELLKLSAIEKTFFPQNFPWCCDDIEAYRNVGNILN